MSRRHAEFRYANGQFEIVDLNSSNGTYLIINDERKPVHGREYLAHNDEVWCGDFILRFFEEDGARPGFDGGAPGTSPPPPSFGGFGQQPAQFGQPPAPQFGQPPQQPSWQQPQNGQFGQPAFGQPDVGHESSLGNEPSFGSEPSFGNEPSFANEPSFGQEPRRGGDATRQSPGYEAGFLDAGADQRLAQERDAYAELAERQKGEIDDLQARLSDLSERYEHQSSELSHHAEGTSELTRLQDELAAATGTMSSMELELQAARSQLLDARSGEVAAQQLEHRLDDLESANARLEHELASARQQANDPAAEAEIVELRGQVDAKTRDISALEGEVDRLTTALRDVEQSLAEQSRAVDQRAREETEAMRRELDRHKRLVEEFEKRNRELQAQVDAADADTSGLEAARASLESDLQTLGADLEAARAERDAARQELAAASENGSPAELRTEIDLLKRRLQDGNPDVAAEVDRMSATIRGLESENAALQAQLQHATVAGGATANDLAAIHGRLEALDRIVDAIVRTNLDPLSTVDRIRLQSAIRDTDPKATLAELLDLTAE